MKHKNKEKSARANPARAERRCSRYATYLIKIFIYYNYEGVHCGKNFFWILKFCFSSSKLLESHFSFSKNEAISRD